MVSKKMDLELNHNELVTVGVLGPSSLPTSVYGHSVSMSPLCLLSCVCLLGIKQHVCVVAFRREV